MGHPKGFLDHKRQTPGYRSVEERIHDFSEMALPLTPDQIKDQAARCMDCGVKFAVLYCGVGGKRELVQCLRRQPYFVIRQTFMIRNKKSIDSLGKPLFRFQRPKEPE